MASNSQERIATFVFLDLETTGLPLSNPKITEISMVAVERNGLLVDMQPRILNKITLMINPDKQVEYDAQKITGLSQSLLLPFPKFDDDTAQLLKLFLGRLPPPLCLLAHNGNNFDFRLLRTELQAIFNKDFDNFFCADTLDGLKDLSKKGLLEEPTSLKSRISTKVKVGKKQAIKVVNQSLKRAYSDSIVLIENSPVVANKVQISGMAPAGGKKSKSVPKAFNLQALYKYFFKSNVEQCHTAESDCLTLLKICHINAFHFCAWVDTNRKPLSSYDPMWHAIS